MSIFLILFALAVIAYAIAGTVIIPGAVLASILSMTVSRTAAAIAVFTFTAVVAVSGTAAVIRAILAGA